jgi:hypothetical protein
MMEGRRRFLRSALVASMVSSQACVVMGSKGTGNLLKPIGACERKCGDEACAIEGRTGGRGGVLSLCFADGEPPFCARSAGEGDFCPSDARV